MNIFYLHPSPEIAAIYLCSRHLNKMGIESNQMLANALDGYTLSIAPPTQKGTVRKRSFLHHPCSKWVLADRANFDWLLIHCYNIWKERKFRTGKSHFGERFTNFLLDINPHAIATWHCHTEPPQCFGKDNEHLISNSAVEGYRKYYNEVKRHSFLMDWGNRGKPHWYHD